MSKIDIYGEQFTGEYKGKPKKQKGRADYWAIHKHEQEIKGAKLDPEFELMITMKTKDRYRDDPDWWNENTDY